MFQLPVSDNIGLAWFLALWIGYTLHTDRVTPREHSLRASMHKNRNRWMQQVLKRENRIMDTQILGQLGQGAFFKFTWSLRQFNYCAVLVGAAPVIGERRDDEWIRRTAWLSTLASKDFNQGLRAYYFGISVIAWFISGWMFMIATAAVVGVLYWREYHSQALRTLELPLAESPARKPTP
jgi:uncharacterized membrane protein